MRVERGVPIPPREEYERGGAVSDHMAARLHVEGRMTLTEIGERYGISRERVRQKVRRYGVPATITKEIARAAQTKFVQWECEGCGTVEWRKPWKLPDTGLCRECYDDRGSKYGRDELLDDLRSLAREVGHTPTIADINAHSPPDHMTFYRLFGSLTKAQKLAGLKPNKAGGRMGPEPLPDEDS